MKRSGLFAAALLLSACANPPDDPVPAGGLAAGACDARSGSGGFTFWAEAPSVPPGATLVLQPWFTPRPGTLQPVPADCLADVGIAGPATLGADGRTVIVDAEASPGDVILVEGRVGAKALAGRILVYQAEAQPLVGAWFQAEEDCPGAEPVRELIFLADGTFSLGWSAPEAAKDYWGAYSHEVASGVLRLKADGGHPPADAGLAGKITLAPGRLHLPPALIGSPPSGKACAAPFRR